MGRAICGVSRRCFVQGAGAVGLGLVAGCGALPFGAGGPPPRAAVVGWLAADNATAGYDVFWHGLAEHGWVQRHNLVPVERSADGHYDRLPALAAELVALPVDVLVTVGTPATLAARAATATIPIIFATGSNPVPYGLAESYQRPGGNVTGMTVLSAELTAKRLELLTAAAPGVSRIAVLWREPAAWPNAQQAAQVLGVDVLSVEVSGIDALQGALDKTAEWGPDALVFEPQPVLVSQFAAFAATHRLPAISGNGGFPGAGGLMSYAPRVQDNFRRAAAYVDKVLRGAKAADLPVEQPMVFDFVINLRTAQALGLSLPQHVLLQATEVLQ